jgi:hypothetical protein
LENLPEPFSLCAGLVLQCLGPSSHASRPITVCAPQSLPVGALLLGAFFPQSSPTPTPRVVAGEFPVTEPSTHRFLLDSVLPPVRPYSGVVTSLLLQCGVLQTLLSVLRLAPRCTVRMPVPTARRRRPRAVRFASQVAGAPSRPGRSLPYARLGSVRWHACVHPCLAHLLATDVRTKIPSASPPCQLLPLLPSLHSAPCERTLALSPCQAVTSLPLSLNRPALLPRNKRL